MTDRPTTPHPPDICVLLHAHGEQRWLVSEIVPVLRQLEEPDAIPDDQRGAALAYLEVLWLDARLRAADTDAAHATLDASDSQRDPTLREKAVRYHAAVRRQRKIIARRIAALEHTHLLSGAHEHASY
jgi:hypothetical protein